MKIWVEIDEARLEANLRALNRAVTHAIPNDPSGPALRPTLLAVVKANAYGHGIAATAPTLARSGAAWLGVTDSNEGIAVRHALDHAAIPRNLQPQILIMSGPDGTAAEAEATLRYALTPVLWTAEHLQALNAAARRLGHTQAIPVHLEIDSGMARQGVQPGPDLDALLNAIAEPDSTITLDGIFTHFASTEVAHSHQTADQRSRFEAALAQLHSHPRHPRLKPRWLHVGNSSYLDNGADPTSLPWLRQLAAALHARPMVRSGLALYGYLLPLELESTAEAALPVTALLADAVKPILSWKTHVIGLRELARGETVGYNGIFIADRPMHLALLPVGYADGLRRELSASNARPGGWVMLSGQRAPIVGRISMNLTVVDVTGIPSVQVGDLATLLGDGITAQDHATLAGTIAYEILCNIKTSP